MTRFDQLYNKIITEQGMIEEGWLGKLAAGTALATSLVAGANAQTVTDLPLPKQPAITRVAPKPEVKPSAPINTRHLGKTYVLNLATKYIAKFEGSKKDKDGNHIAYKDIKGVDTIGYGSTDPNLVAKKKITEAEAQEALQKEIENVYNALEKKFGKDWKVMDDFQQAALISLYFNVGVNKTFDKLQKNIKAHNWRAAAKEFLDIDNITVKQNGKDVKKKVAGLTARRKTEANNIFLFWVNHDTKLAAKKKA